MLEVRQLTKRFRRQAVVDDVSFTIHPGEILVATDTTGSGHKWRLIDDQPWKRIYVVFKEGAKVNFRPDGTH